MWGVPHYLSVSVSLHVCVCVSVCYSEEQRLDHLTMKHFYDDKLHDATQPSQRRSVHCACPVFYNV